MDKALNVVEEAEDWVSRVRELLQSDYSIEPPEKQTASQRRRKARAAERAARLASGEEQEGDGENKMEEEER